MTEKVKITQEIRPNVLLLLICMSVEMLESILPIHSKIPQTNFYIFVRVLYPTYIHSKNAFVYSGIYGLPLYAFQKVLLICCGMV